MGWSSGLSGMSVVFIRAFKSDESMVAWCDPSDTALEIVDG